MGLWGGGDAQGGADTHRPGLPSLTELRSLDDALYLVRAELVGLLAQPRLRWRESQVGWFVLGRGAPIFAPVAQGGIPRELQVGALISF